jgi:rare lipoprotein A
MCYTFIRTKLLGLREIDHLKRIFLILSLLLVFFLPSILTAETGYASWYGGKFHGRTTASGETFDTHSLTAAHKTLPFNTIVKVTNLENGETVRVRINDRGPFVKGRIIDLSMAAAKAIGILGRGVAPVKIEIVPAQPGEIPAVTQATPLHYSIQVASFTDQENATRLFESLSDRGFSPQYEKSETGHIRVILPSVREKDLKPFIHRLAQLGYTSVLVRRHFE